MLLVLAFSDAVLCDERVNRHAETVAQLKAAADLSDFKKIEKLLNDRAKTLAEKADLIEALEKTNRHERSEILTLAVIQHFAIENPIPFAQRARTQYSSNLPALPRWVLDNLLIYPRNNQEAQDQQLALYVVKKAVQATPDLFYQLFSSARSANKETELRAILMDVFRNDRQAFNIVFSHEALVVGQSPVARLETITIDRNGLDRAIRRTRSILEDFTEKWRPKDWLYDLKIREKALLRCLDHTKKTLKNITSAQTAEELKMHSDTLLATLLAARILTTPQSRNLAISFDSLFNTESGINAYKGFFVGNLIVNSSAAAVAISGNLEQGVGAFAVASLANILLHSYHFEALDERQIDRYLNPRNLLALPTLALVHATTLPVLAPIRATQNIRQRVLLNKLWKRYVQEVAPLLPPGFLSTELQLHLGKRASKQLLSCNAALTAIP